MSPLALEKMVSWADQETNEERLGPSWNGLIHVFLGRGLRGVKGPMKITT